MVSTPCLLHCNYDRLRMYFTKSLVFVGLMAVLGLASTAAAQQITPSVSYVHVLVTKR